MRPAKVKFKKFKMDPKYVHMRSEGLTRRSNGGTRQLLLDDFENPEEECTSQPRKKKSRDRRPRNAEE